MRPPRRGFTLMEMIVVTVIIGILASVAIFSLRDSRSKAVTATMHSDLRNLAVAQEGFYYQHAFYAPDLAQLPVGTSPGVTLTVTSANDKGWGATADHPSGVQSHCAIFYGEPPARPAPAIADGVIACQ